MAGGWRTAAKMIVVAAVATAVSRSAEARRRQADDALRRKTPEPPPTTELVTRPAAFVEAPARLTTTAFPMTASSDHVVIARASTGDVPWAGPTLAPTTGIGFRSTSGLAPNVAEVTAVRSIPGPESGAPSGEPATASEPRRSTPVVHTAASIIEDLNLAVPDPHAVLAEIADGTPSQTAGELSAEPPAEEPPAEEPEPTREERVQPDDDAVADGPAEPVAYGPNPYLTDLVHIETPEPAPADEVEIEPEASEAQPVEAQPVVPLHGDPLAYGANPYLTDLAHIETPEPAPADEVESLELDEPASVRVPPPVPEPQAPEPLDRADDLDPPSPQLPVARQGSALENLRRQRTGAVTGTVLSSRGDKLVGIHVSVIDDSGRVAAEGLSRADGTFEVADLPTGTYRLKAHDEHGDYATGWIGGSSSDRAKSIKVGKGKTVRKADFRLLSTTEIDVRVDVGEQRMQVKIWVTERGAGIPATGSVRLTTSHFSNVLKLTQGRAIIKLPGSPEGAEALIEGLEVHYKGHKHTLPQAYTAAAR